jgi:hypothetical protein
MARLVILLAAAAAMAASPAWARPRAPAIEGGQASQEAAVAARFAPYDKAALKGWSAATPTPIYRNAGDGDSVQAPFALQPGGYRVVVLCDCRAMDVTLSGADGARVPADRSGDQGAVYTFDVPSTGTYVAGIDMNECARDVCVVGVKVYRKAS